MNGSRRRDLVRRSIGAPEIVTEPLSVVVDKDAFTPRLLALISTALVWRESRILKREFGLGTNDWRAISVLSIRPGATSTEISEFSAMNKAVVSKSVHVLIARGLVVAMDGPRGSYPLYLTRAGAEMHDRMLPVSMKGQEILLAGLSAEEVAQLNDLLTRLLSKTLELSSSAEVDPALQ
jgi:DNA-binding MarR family transcriptional regulator